MKPTLGTQLRHLLELLDGAVEQSYRDAGLAYRPRYTPVVRALIAHEPATIGEIAEAASISQPAVTQTIALMTREGLVASRPGTTDGRQRLIRLTDAGRSLLPRLQDCWQATAAAAARFEAELPMPLSQAVAHAIANLEALPFSERIALARHQLARKPLATRAPRKSRS
jgi:DNA-binding MarR family transcriptional regulator